MKNIKLLAALFLGAASVLAPVSASAWDPSDLGKLGNILGAGKSGSNSDNNKSDGNILSNLIEGVFTKSDISVDDMAGVWTVNGSAVAFKSDNALAKAGGVAAAAAMESKLNPYYTRYGLNGGTLTINRDSTFTMKLKKMTLSGTVSRKSDGNFAFNFKVFKKINLGSVTAYVQQTGSKKLKVMFDATFIKKLFSAVAGLSDQSLFKGISSLLDKYDGVCIGFALDKTGEVAGTPASASPSTPSDSVSTPSNNSDAKDKAKQALGNILKKK